jgi:hypothetical protein
MRPFVSPNALCAAILQKCSQPLLIAALFISSPVSSFAEGEIDPPASDALARAAAGDFSYTLRGKDDSFLLELEPEKDIKDSWQKIEVFTLSNPNRLVVDIPHAQAVPRSPRLAENKHVKSIRFGKHKLKTRIVLDTEGAFAPQYHFSKDPKSDRVVVSLNFADEPDTSSIAKVSPTTEIAETAADESPKLVSLDDLRRAVSKQIAERKPEKKVASITKETANPLEAVRDTEVAKDEPVSDTEVAVSVGVSDVKRGSDAKARTKEQDEISPKPKSNYVLADGSSGTIPAPAVKSATLKSSTTATEKEGQYNPQLASFEKSPAFQTEKKLESVDKPEEVASAQNSELSDANDEDKKREIVAARIKNLEGAPTNTTKVNGSNDLFKASIESTFGESPQAPVFAKRIAGGVIISLRSKDTSQQALNPRARARMGDAPSSIQKGELRGISYERNSDGSFSSLRIRVSNLRTFKFRKVSEQEYRLQLVGTKNAKDHRALCSPQTTASIQAIVPQGNRKGTEMKIFVDRGVKLEARRSQDGLLVRAIDNRSRDL